MLYGLERNKLVIKKFFSISIWKDSLSVAVALIAAIETILAICDFGVKDFYDIKSWWVKLIIILTTFLTIWLITAVLKYATTYKSITININNTPITIKQGDLFSSNDWKVIPFNEYFDTQVDDIVIAHNSLNGILIDHHIDNLQDLQFTLNNPPNVQKLPHKIKGGRICHPLGRIIKYGEFMILAFTHFDNNNQATLTHNQYESCLRTMWNEISRTYANKPVSLPLLGGGITRFENPSIKTETQLLKCLLCTFRTSNATINQPITIYLTQDAIRNIDLYSIKKQFK